MEKDELEEKVEDFTDLEESNSEIKIADDVISVIAGMAVSEVQGVYGMAKSFAGGISEALSGKKNYSKGIKVEATDKLAKIDVNIIVDYGVRIPDVAFEIQNKVKKSVEAMTGLKVTEINVHIQGVHTNSNEEQEVAISDNDDEENEEI
ncbi:MAG: Asp23/Gls24 family envelope stress response protein [Clostridia bacterium]|nr:Asp23/Gls24 family envelope stress response protein [Clostridia bacterium]